MYRIVVSMALLLAEQMDRILNSSGLLSMCLISNIFLNAL